MACFRAWACMFPLFPMPEISQRLVRQLFAFDLPRRASWHGRQRHLFSAWYDQSFMHDMYRFVCSPWSSPDFLDFGVPECLRVLLKQNGLPLIMWPARSRAQLNSVLELSEIRPSLSWHMHNRFDSRSDRMRWWHMWSRLLPQM
jgi:hypothetical protein